MTLRELAIAIGFKVDKNSESQAEKSINGIKNMATKLLGVIGVGFSIQGLGQLAEAAADAEALKSQFTQVFGDLEDSATEKLDAIAEETGVMSNRIKGSFTQIAAFAKTTGMEQADALNLSERAMRAVADSAAFYDKTIEQQTEALRSFLKMNFENDAALGLSCTETTRNTAANKLYGKSFNDLSESQKQLTLLQMVEDANKTSGALGQAARESDTWTNQLGNLKQSMQDLKAAAGKGFLENAVSVLKFLSEHVQKATVAVQHFTREGGPFNRFMDKATKGVQALIGVLKVIVTHLGGVTNVLKLVSIALASAFVVKNAKGFVSFLSGIGKGLTSINVKMLAIIAIVALIVLVIDDFMNFMKGNDSVIGSILEKMGVDTEKVRDTIKNAWSVVVNFLKTAWGLISSAASTIWGGLTSFFTTHAEQIKHILTTAWSIISALLQAAFAIIKEFAMIIFNALADFWAQWGDKIMAQFGIIGEFLSSMADAWLKIFQGILDFVSAVFVGDWEAAWNAIQEIFTGVWEAIQHTAEFIWGSITNFFGEKIEEIKQKVFGWYDAIVEKVSSAAGFIKDLLGMDGSVDVAVNSATAKAAASNHSGSGRNINQTNSIYNTFNGGTAYQQKTAANAMSKSGDDLTKSLRLSMANS